MMRRSTKWFTKTEVSFLFVMHVTRNDCAYGASVEHEKIVEAAKKDGRLVLYTGMDTDEANLYTKEFAKQNPFIKPDIFRSSGEKVQTRFLVEHRANVHNADIFQTSIVQVYQLKNAGLLSKYVSEESRTYADG